MCILEYISYSMFCDLPGDSCLILGTVDAYGHLIVSRLDTVAEGNFTTLYFESITCLNL